jgi:NTP pyrophosphatase (non-canonical NTP hydrolase)
MKLQEYIPLAIRTESPRSFGLPTQTTRLFHAAVGICTEVAELVAHNGQLNLREELGDVAWYLAIAYNALEIQIPDCFRPVSSGYRPFGLLQKDLVVESGELIDLFKKHVFYGKPLDPQDVRDHLIKILGLLIDTCDSVHEEFEVVLEANVRKLTARYPEQFTTAAALNRDLQAETKALEG